MKRKKYIVVAVVLNTALLVFGARFYGHFPREALDGGGAYDPRATMLAGHAWKFGPVMERVLPAAEPGESEILDLETGRMLLQKGFEHFNFRADAITTWIRSNGLDISCFLLPNGAACVTYDMAIMAVEGKCWQETTEDELLGNPALTPRRDSPRRLLVLGHDRPDTYIFRTGEGTLGILRIVGLSPHQRGVKIRYKLINPSKSLSVAL